MISAPTTITTPAAGEIDGTPATHYRAAVDLAKAAKLEGIPDPTLQQRTQSGAPTPTPSGRRIRPPQERQKKRG